MAWPTGVLQELYNSFLFLLYLSKKLYSKRLGSKFPCISPALSNVVIYVTVTLHYEVTRVVEVNPEAAGEIGDLNLLFDHVSR